MAYEGKLASTKSSLGDLPNASHGHTLNMDAKADLISKHAQQLSTLTFEEKTLRSSCTFTKGRMIVVWGESHDLQHINLQTHLKRKHSEILENDVRINNVDTRQHAAQHRYTFYGRLHPIYERPELRASH
ncbi:hypothetical protein PR048_031656 [Dryococelus australis]|uniref:Uncharacterized protein n=1 Tax=Dryococelus australis TaxID=614101 RepID=A0ABQ9G8I8_9NEOP|nr:hypothetical protein PR048_031656 [Dryococelus australis]